MSKDEIKCALLAKDFEKVAQSALDDRKVFRTLISLAYDKEELLCWRAIEAMGKAAGAISEKDPSTVRNTVQRLLWSMSEESGGIGWSAPEMLAEIVINAPGACADIPPIILSFHEEESFLKGVLWAMGRLDRAGIDGIGSSYEVAKEALSHEDPAVRGLALYAMPLARLAEAAVAIEKMVSDDGRLKVYQDHELVETWVGEIARRILDRYREGRKSEESGKRR